MKIDRERFLFLAAALAACNSQQPPPEAPNTPNPSQPVVIPMQPPAQPPSPSSTPIATTAPSADPTTSPVASAAPTSAPAAKSPNPYEGTPVTAQSCNPSLNSQGAAPACTLTAPGPTCESFRDTKKECPTLNQLLKPRVATAAIECLRRKSGTQDICEFNVTSICAYEALGSACLDPSAKTACNAVMTKCGGGAGPTAMGAGAGRGHYNKMSRESCEAGVSGIADAKRKKFISCITEFCRFETCLTYL